MTGIAILAAALLMLCCATVLLYISIIGRRTGTSGRRVVERQKIPADWDRILRETELK